MWLLRCSILTILLIFSAQSHAQIVQFSGAATNTGWTTFTATAGTGTCGNSSSNYTGTCIVYVSSSAGNDSTCAAVVYTASSFTPCATISKGASLLRNNSSDWLLLKKGDTFLPDSNGHNVSVGSSAFWTLEGASSTAPMVVGSYDPSQPGVVDPATSGARPLIENAHGTVPLSATNGGSQGDYTAWVGLEFYNYTEDPNNASYNPTWSGPSGVEFFNFVTWSLIEDCKFSFYGFNISYDTSNNTNPNANTSAIILNRNVVIDAYGVSPSNSSGLFIGGQAGLASGVASVTMTGNVFDHNGWNATVSNAGPTTHNHNIYIECINASYLPSVGFETIQNNIMVNDSEAPQFRLSGTYTNNLTAYTPNGLAIGASTAHTEAYCTGPATTASMTYNVFLNSNFNTAVTGGGAIGSNNLTSPANMTNNIISTVASSEVFANAVEIITPNADNVVQNNTFWDWTNDIQDLGGTGDTLSPNDYNCTTCYSGGTYPDPYRSLGSYYYANVASPTSTAVITGTINNCSPSCAGSTTAGNVMNVTGVTSGTLNVGDAIVYSGQSIAVTITGNSTIAPGLCGGSSCTGTGGTGTYAVNIAVKCNQASTWTSCTSGGATPLLVTSQTLTDYSGQSLIALMDLQSKANWNPLYDSCHVNGYIQQGFGQAANCNN